MTKRAPPERMRARDSLFPGRRHAGGRQAGQGPGRRNYADGSTAPRTASACQDGGRSRMSMGKSIWNLSTVTRVGLDLANKVFQVHSVDAKGDIVAAHSSGITVKRILLVPVSGLIASSRPRASAAQSAAGLLFKSGDERRRSERSADALGLPRDVRRPRRRPVLQQIGGQQP
jgi:hypothetical protein